MSFLLAVPCKKMIPQLANGRGHCKYPRLKKVVCNKNILFNKFGLENETICIRNLYEYCTNTRIKSIFCFRLTYIIFYPLRILNDCKISFKNQAQVQRYSPRNVSFSDENLQMVINSVFFFLQDEDSLGYLA